MADGAPEPDPAASEDQGPEPPLRLPAGVRLPDGLVLTFPPHLRCGGQKCVEAFDAWRAGTLDLPPEGEEGGRLPW